MKIVTQRRLGASDAAPLLGLSKYATTADVYARIVLGRKTKETPQMARGKKYEPEVRRRYIERTGAQMQIFASRPLIVQHPRLEWATVSPDDLTVDGLLCEYKTASRWAKGWVDPDTNEDTVPIDYVLQVAWGLWVTGLSRAHLYVLFGEDGKDAAGAPTFEPGREAGPFVFTRDAELEAAFEEVGAHFWTHHVLAKVPPVPLTTQQEATP